jgi:hypothetical protein
MPNPLPVKGYTAQTEDKIVLVDQSKMIEELALRQVDRHVAMENVDQRFVALARTHLQEAFMCLNRAVFQPQRLDDSQMNGAEDLANYLLGGIK